MHTFQSLSWEEYPIDFKEKWIHLRKSNTEPIIRIYSEAKSKEIAIQLVEEMKTHVYSIINQ